jgi:hypothetical protein
MPSFVNFNPYFLNSKCYVANYHTVCSRFRTEFTQYVRGSTRGLVFKIKKRKICVILGFRHELDENCALLGCYSARGGNTR